MNTNVLVNVHSKLNNDISSELRSTDLVALGGDEATQVDSCPNYRPSGPQTTFNLQFVSLCSRLSYLRDFVNSKKHSVIY